MRVLDLLFDRLATGLTGLFLLVALASIAAQVFFRYVLSDSLVWGEELARYALVWSSMLGAAVAYRQGRHIAVTELTSLLPVTARRLAARAVNLIVLAFSVLLLWQGAMLVLRNLARNQKSTALQIDIAWVQLAIPVAAALLIVAAAESLWQGGRAPGEISGETPDP